MRQYLKLFLLSLSGFCSIQQSISQYQPNWSSLDQRPVPQWYRDAKFGIFIHWGVYSVPGFSSKGSYAEWYQNGLMNHDSVRINYHKIKFGNRSYYDLATDFKAELFEPDEWAKVFEQSGAKYIVLTSKHHDGFTLWPDKTANKTWGFPWNAGDVGPRRDLLGDLFKAVRKTSVHAGMYYSLYEWYNPLWKADHARYATEHVWPQAKYLINTYQPDVFWTDGDWDASAETWKSQELLAWMYNESPVKDKVVTFDRWGSGIRFKHGGVYTPEYQPDLDFEDHAWEESRGMGYSYGYNRAEDSWDYNSTQSLVLQLIDKVSRGGNFLLDIGPDEHGKIPPIMQERLLQLGAWLKINGEAIYNTVRWKTPAQWSEGRRDYKSKSGDMLLKITIDPDPGYAVKELFYTYNSSNNDLYVILPKYPQQAKISLNNMELPANTKISLLDGGKELHWSQRNGNIEIEFPSFYPGKPEAQYAYVLKIHNYGKFAAKPRIQVNEETPAAQPLVSLSGADNSPIHYTLDGTEPTIQSPVYKTAFMLDKTATVKAIAIPTAALPSATAAQKVKVYEWKPAIKPANPQPGIRYKYFEPTDNISMKSLETTPVKTSGIAQQINESVKERKDRYALSFEGYIRIDADGFYNFSTLSDDGSKLFIDDEEIVDNDGDHGSVEQKGRAALRKGSHKIRVDYFDSGGGNELKVYWEHNGKKEIVPAGALMHGGSRGVNKF